MRQTNSVVGLLAAAGLAFAAGAAQAQGDEDETMETLRGYSLEELANLQVITVSRRAESVARASAAIYVITPADIRRSGATSLPEVLREAPNLQVSRANSYVYAVSARGFNSFEASNKLLVRIDGRSVYSPAHSGVFWQNLDVMLADVARIEVVSGPGGALWGSNAVNGIINVQTRPAGETQGLLIDGGVGPDERFLNLRYGFRLGENTAMRVFGGSFVRGLDEPSARDPQRYDFRGGFGGLRLDHQRDDDGYVLQAEAYRNVDRAGEQLSGGDVSARWRRALSDTSNIRTQVYFERFYRGQPPIYTETLHTWDFQAQHDFVVGDHAVVWGAEFRRWDDTFTIHPALILGFKRPHANLDVANLFVQDEVMLSETLRLTAGLKAERSSYSGMEYLPSLRLAWRPAEGALLWGAVSQTSRSPNRIERELQFPGVLRSSPEYRSEKAFTVETGYRGRPNGRTNLTVNLFYTRYDDIRTAESVPGGQGFIGNGLRGESWGAEVWGVVELTPAWRLKAGGAWLHMDIRLKPGHTDTLRQALGYDPEIQGQIRSEATLAEGLTFDLGLRGVGQADDPLTKRKRVPAYVEADARLAWRVRPDIELSLAGFNLLHERHREYFNPATAAPRDLPRTVYAGLRWGF